MIDISKGRYWDEGIKLVESCTRISPGCDHCWSLAMEKRFNSNNHKTIGRGIWCHPDRLKRFNTRKSKVFSLWNDLFHEAVPWEFQYKVYVVASNYPQNTILALTKRPANMVKSLKDVFFHLNRNGIYEYDHIWHGLTVCNQQEWDDKERWFLQIPGKKFISHEPALETIHYGEKLALIDCLISGGETGAGARPSHPNTFRSDRDQCAAAGVDFFFKGWGEYAPAKFQIVEGCVNHTNGHYWYEFDHECGNTIKKLGKKKAGRLLDGRAHDELPWRKP